YWVISIFYEGLTGAGGRNRPREVKSLLLGEVPLDAQGQVAALPDEGASRDPRDREADPGRGGQERDHVRPSDPESREAVHGCGRDERLLLDDLLRDAVVAARDLHEEHGLPVAVDRNVEDGREQLVPRGIDPLRRRSMERRQKELEPDAALGLDAVDGRPEPGRERA